MDIEESVRALEDTGPEMSEFDAVDLQKSKFQVMT